MASDEVENHFEDDFNYSAQNISDDPSTSLRDFFEDCFDFMDEGRHRGNCLVHCNATKPGLSRSCSICIAYMMVKEKKRMQDAFNDVKEARSFVKPSEAFMKQLKDLDEELFGVNKKDDIEDAFTKKKRQEIEAEKEMLKGRVKLTEKVKMFADITSPEVSSPGTAPLRTESPALGSVKSKWNQNINQDDRRRSSTQRDDLPVQPKKLTSIISLFNKPREEMNGGSTSLRNFGPSTASSTPVKKWKTVEPPPPPGFCKTAVKRNKSRKWAFQNNVNQCSTDSTSSVKKNTSRSSLRRLNSRENSLDMEPKNTTTANNSSTNKTNANNSSGISSTREEKPLLRRQQSRQNESSVASNGVSSSTKPVTVKNNSVVPPPPPPMPVQMMSPPKVEASPSPVLPPWRKTSNGSDRSTASSIASDTVSNTSSLSSNKSSTKKEPAAPYTIPITVIKGTSGQAKEPERVAPTVPSTPPVAPPPPTRMVFGKVKPPPMKFIGSGLSTESSRPPQVPKVPERKDSINVLQQPKAETKEQDKRNNNNPYTQNRNQVKDPKPIIKSVESDSEEDEIESESDSDEASDVDGEYTRIYDHRRPSDQPKGLNRSSTMEILQLIKSKTGADLAQHAHLDNIDEDEEIDNLLAGLESEGIDNVDWNELGIDVGEVKNIVEKHEDDEDTCEYTEEEEEVTADEEEEEPVELPSKWRSKV